MPPAPIVNVMASIFREGFHNVNDLGNASGKEGLQGEKWRVTLSLEDTLSVKRGWYQHEHCKLQGDSYSGAINEEKSKVSRTQLDTLL